MIEQLKTFDVTQLDVFESMVYAQYRKEGKSKHETLQIMINNCEGDYSQLSEGLAEIAREYTQD